MKKRLAASVSVLAMTVGLMSGISVNAEEISGVTVEENESSVTGYSVDFSYTDAEATNVNLVGGFQFYTSGDLNVYANGFVLPANDSQANHCISPYDWQPNAGLKHVNDTGYTVEMTKNEETGEWTTSLDLPGGYYLYQFKVSYDNGETFQTIADPTNVAACNEWGANQTRSQFFVPYDEKQGDEEYYDWSWATPIEDASLQGTVEGFSYEGLDGTQLAEIYLPAGYDADREEAYKVLYLSHGGGGDEGDWFYQGNAGNILDRLIADGETEPFVVVCMNNTVYVQNFQADENDRSYSSNDDYFMYCYENIKDYLIPYVEENYNVSTEVEGKAFTGLSNGAKLTTEIFINDPNAFSYFGLFSGSAAWAWPQLEDYSDYQNANVYLAAGYADQLMMQNTYHTDGDKTLMGIKEDLDAAGIVYNNGGCYVTVEGAHDWFTWQQMLKDYVSTTLWK